MTIYSDLDIAHLSREMGINMTDIKRMITLGIGVKDWKKMANSIPTFNKGMVSISRLMGLEYYWIGMNIDEAFIWFKECVEMA